MFVEAGYGPNFANQLIQNAYSKLFEGDPIDERVCFDASNDMSYIIDIGHDDIRSEGMSYGMYITALTGHEEQFNKLWNFSKRYLRNDDGPHVGYFSWQVSTTDFSKMDPGAAPDSRLPPDEVARMVGACKDEVERLDSIITGFLSAIRPGRPRFASVDLKQLVIEVLEFMRPEIDSRRVKVNCDWANGLPTVSGDASQLKQAFYNIIRNAVQAMTNGGILAICGYRTDDFLVTEFADSGSGIGPEALSTMFNAFRSNRSGGNGIGTMIVERICREHGAEFGLVTEPERGTVFQVRFPLAERRLRMLPPPEPGNNDSAAVK